MQKKTILLSIAQNSEFFSKKESIMLDWTLRSCIAIYRAAEQGESVGRCAEMCSGLHGTASTDPMH